MLFNYAEMERRIVESHFDESIEEMTFYSYRSDTRSLISDLAEKIANLSEYYSGEEVL